MGTGSKYLNNEAAANQLLALSQALAFLPTWNAQLIEKQVKLTAKKLKLTTKDLINLIRIAVSGQLLGPNLYMVLELLGCERTLQRTKQCAANIKRKFLILDLFLGK